MLLLWIAGCWLRLPAARGAASGADALNSGGRFVGLESRAARKIQKSAAHCGIGDFLDGAASAAGEFVAGFLGPGDPIEDRTRAGLAPPDDPASLEEGQGAVDGGPREAAALPFQPQSQRLRVEVAGRLGDRVEHVTAGDGGP